MKVFPTGVKVSVGEVHILKDSCKGCGFCVIYCPMDVLEVSTDFNTKGYHFPVIRNPDKCINCGLCEMLCPDFAIWSTLKAQNEVVSID